MGIPPSIARMLCTAAALGLAACATPYQPYSYWKGGGFTETEVQPGLFLVRFIGNESTTPGRTADFALLRAADICLRQGRDYMLLGDVATRSVPDVHPSATTTTVVPADGGTVVSVQTLPSTLHYSPESGLTVSCLETKRDGAWDANYLARAIRTRYSLT